MFTAAYNTIKYVHGMKDETATCNTKITIRISVE